MSWTLAPALVELRDELNALWPSRDHASDGAIGDTAHAATASDHNPNAQGVVCAYDVDTDLDGTDDSNDPEMDALAEWLRAHPHPDQAMLIYRASDSRFGIATREAKYGYPAWAWRPYTKDPHISHLHVSVGEGPEGQRRPGTYDNTSPWLAGFGAVPLSPTQQPPQEEDMIAAAFVLISDAEPKDAEGPVYLAGPTIAPRHVSSFPVARDVASRLGLTLVAPPDNGKKTVDGRDGQPGDVWVVKKIDAELFGL